MGTGDTVERLLAYWQRRYGMVQGQRNANVLILAQWMNEHGVPLHDALSACLPMQDPSGSAPFTADEIRRAVQSGYRRTVAGSNPWITSKAPQPPPQAHPYRMQAGFTLSPSERAAMVAMFREAMQAEVAPQVGEGRVPRQAPAAPAAPLTAGEQALQRMAARNPAVTFLVGALDLDIVNSRVRLTNGEKQG